MIFAEPTTNIAKPTATKKTSTFFIFIFPSPFSWTGYPIDSLLSSHFKSLRSSTFLFASPHRPPKNRRNIL